MPNYVFFFMIMHTSGTYFQNVKILKKKENFKIPPTVQTGNIMQKYVDVCTQGTFSRNNLFIIYLERMPASIIENATTANTVKIEYK